MLDYFLKSIPSEFAFAGYSVRKGISVMTSVIDGKIVYDVFLYTYLDNYLSFYILMEDGKYKNVSEKVNVDLIKGDELVSTHLFRGENYDANNYPKYEKDKIIGVFGLCSIPDLMKKIDARERDNGENKMSIQALMDVKNKYTGMEINSAINRFNNTIKDGKVTFMIPAISYGSDDSYVSPIGDEFDYYDFIFEKEDDQIVKDLYDLYKKEIK